MERRPAVGSPIDTDQRWPTGSGVVRGSLPAFVIFLAACPSPETGDTPREGASRKDPASEAEPIAAARELPPRVVASNLAVPPGESGAKRTTPKLAGRPWSLDRAAFRPPNIPDGLTFHGWSRDGSRFAFERHVEAEGADCSEHYVLYAVDAAQDDFLQGGVVEVRHETPEGDEQGACRPPSLEPAVSRKRRTFLKMHRIVAGRLIPPVSVERDARGAHFVLRTGQRVDVKFSVLHRAKAPYAQEADRGAAYRLELSQKDRKRRVLEDGTRRRPGVMDYRLGEARVFVSPEGTHLAFFVERVERAFEGGRISWMVNGGPVP